jgi:hypothetical protein
MLLKDDLLKIEGHPAAANAIIPSFFSHFKEGLFWEEAMMMMSPRGYTGGGERTDDRWDKL